MLLRYISDESGRQRKVAKVFTADEHGINPALIDEKAVAIVRRLQESEYEAYIVGGAVRDLLQGRTPKDFDISTSAHPRQIKKLFWNSRIIGRRFKLVHIHYPDKIYEVSTFRSGDSETDSNMYGTILEDAFRRDFSVNALYYCPIKQLVVDYVGGMKDFHSRIIRSVVPLEKTFLEDPVRMVRGIKYAAITGFSMKFSLKRAIRRHSSELVRASSSRMTEEVFKLLASGKSQQIFQMLMKKQLLVHMLPVLDELMLSGRSQGITDALYSSLGELDGYVESSQSVQREKMLYHLVKPFLLIPDEYESTTELFRDLFKDIKRLIQPITPPNIEVEKATALFFIDEDIKVPKHAVRKPKVPVQRQGSGRRPGGRRRSRKKKTAPQKEN